MYDNPFSVVFLFLFVYPHGILIKNKFGLLKV